MTNFPCQVNEFLIRNSAVAIMPASKCNQCWWHRYDLWQGNYDLKMRVKHPDMNYFYYDSCTFCVNISKLVTSTKSMAYICHFSSQLGHRGRSFSCWMTELKNLNFYQTKSNWSGKRNLSRLTFYFSFTVIIHFMQWHDAIKHTIQRRHYCYLSH